MIGLLLLRQRELERTIEEMESDGVYRPDLEEELESLRKLNGLAEQVGVDLGEHDGNQDLEEEVHQRELEAFHYEQEQYHLAYSR